MLSGKTIFVAALDWGLGHATRCVPVIRRLEKENKIIIGVTPLTRIIFDQEFPELEKVNIPAYNIRYSLVLPLWLKLMMAAPRISSVIKKEYKFLQKIIAKKKIDVVISDSRFGLFSEKIPSVFITHQLFLKTPFANRLLQKQNRDYLLRFNEIWIPDYMDEKISLSGTLSHGEHFHKNVKYIGPQTRLETIPAEKKYDCLFLVSGPEPQQSIFLDQCISLAKKNSVLKYAMIMPKVRSLPGNPVEFYFAPSAIKLSQLICESKTVICRSGYSTLMDMHALGARNLILVPTPGQTEQEYLAVLWKEKFGAIISDQNSLAELQLNQS